LNEVNIDLSSQLTNDINAFISLDVNTPTNAAAVVDYEKDAANTSMVRGLSIRWKEMP